MNELPAVAEINRALRDIARMARELREELTGSDTRRLGKRPMPHVPSLGMRTSEKHRKG